MPTAATSPASALAPLQYRTSWVGNSFGGGEKWVQNFTEALLVAPDGTLYTNSTWDEAGREVGVYRDGDVIGRADHTHGWGYLGGRALALNSKYLFVGQIMGNEGGGLKEPRSFPPKGFSWLGVSRRKRENIAQVAPFEGGKGGDGGTIANSLLVVSENKEKSPANIAGMCADETRLYVSDGAQNKIVTYNADSMQKLGEWPLANPGALALDRQGDIWAVSGGKSVSCFSPSGQKRNVKVALPKDSLATSLSFAPDGRLVICDNGPRQQVLFFDAQSGKLVGTFGERGGMFGADPGRVGPMRLAGPMGAGFDARGNFYVACNVPRGGTVLRAYSPAPKREMKWELLNLEFVDVADAVPGSNGREVYSADERYAFNPDAPAGQGWTWRAHTLDPFRYPDDLRLHQGHLQCGTSVRKLGGETFLCQRGMWQGILGFYRIEGDLAVPSTVLSSMPIKSEKEDGSIWRPSGQPEAGRFFWRDLNGDGRFNAGEYTATPGPEGEYWASNVDARGDIWQAGQESGIWKWTFSSLDARKNPTYDAKPQHWAMPAPFSNLLRTEYLPETDTMYVTGQAPDHAMSGGEWGTAGSVLVRYDHWSTTPKIAYRVDLPYEAEKLFMVSFHVAGDLCFFVDSRKANVYVYDNRDGRFLGKMKPGPEVSGESGWVDFRDGLRATRLQDGSYLVFVEEDAKGKSIAYRLQDPLKNGA